MELGILYGDVQGRVHPAVGSGKMGGRVSEPPTGQYDSGLVCGTIQPTV
jgi:hypothetical protein